MDLTPSKLDTEQASPGFLDYLKSVVLTFSGMSSLGFVRQTDLRRCFEHSILLKSESVKEVLKSYDQKAVPWRELVFEFIVEPLKIQGNIDDLFDQVEYFKQVSKKKRKQEETEGEDETTEEEIESFILNKDEFLEARIFLRNYFGRKHTGLSHSEMVEAMFLLTSEDGERADYRQLLMLFCQAFTPLESFFRLFATFSGKRRNQIIPTSILSLFLRMNKMNECGTREKMEDIMKQQFGEVVSFSKFRESEYGEKMMNTIGPFVTRKVSQHKLMKFVQFDDERRVYQLNSRNPFDPMKPTCGLISTYYIHKICSILDDEAYAGFSIDEIQELINENDLKMNIETQRTEILANLVHLMKQNRKSQAYQIIKRNLKKYEREKKKKNKVKNDEKSENFHDPSLFKMAILDGIEYEEKKIKGFGSKKSKYRDECCALLEKYRKVANEEIQVVEISDALIEEMKLKIHYGDVVKYDRISKLEDEVLGDIILLDPTTSGEELLELLTDPTSSFRIPPHQLSNCFFLVDRTLDKSQTAIYFDTKDLLMDADAVPISTGTRVKWKFSIDGGMYLESKKEIFSVLRKAVWEVKFGLRKFVAMNWLTNNGSHWMGIFIRQEKETKHLEIFVTDNFCGKRVMGELIRKKGMDWKDEKDPIFTTRLYENVVRVVEDLYKFLDQVDGDERLVEFWRELLEKMGAVEFEKGKMLIEEMLVDKKRSVGVEEKKVVHRVLSLLEVFGERKTMKSFEELRLENIKLRKEIKRLKGQHNK